MKKLLIIILVLIGSIARAEQYDILEITIWKGVTTGEYSFSPKVPMNDEILNLLIIHASYGFHKKTEPWVLQFITTYNTYELSLGKSLHDAKKRIRLIMDFLFNDKYLDDSKYIIININPEICLSGDRRWEN